MSIEQGYIEKMEGNVATPLQPGFFAKNFATVADTITEALNRRRGFCDEMEKLIGVRQLDKHPDGIHGGAAALLGITDKLEGGSAARWKDFVISELLHYVRGVGTTEELMTVIDAKQKALVDQMSEAWAGYTVALAGLDVVEHFRENPSKYMSGSFGRTPSVVADSLREASTTVKSPVSVTMPPDKAVKPGYLG